MTSPKIKNQRQLKAIVSALKKKGKTIAFTNGCFDIIHPGHIEYLSEAKKMADVLIVALNTDASIKRIKGPCRPVMNLKERQGVVCGLENVDYVSSFSQDTPAKLIGLIKPDFVIKGGDWKARDIVGGAIVKKYGGEAVSVRYKKGYSTTGIIDRIIKTKQ